MYGIIYKATNRLNGKVYIGQTTKCLEERKKQHIYLSQQKEGSKNYFHRALIRHGESSFTWEVIDTAYSKEELDGKEQDWIVSYEAFGRGGYNLTHGGQKTNPRKTEVFVFDTSGELLAVCESQKEASEVFNVRNNIVSQVISGKRPVYKNKVFLPGEGFKNLKEMFDEVSERYERERLKKYKRFVVIGIDESENIHTCSSLFEMSKLSGVAIKTILDECEDVAKSRSKWRFCFAIHFAEKEPDMYERHSSRKASLIYDEYLKHYHRFHFDNSQNECYI